MKIQLQAEQLYLCTEEKMMSDDLFQSFYIAKKMRYAYYSQRRIFVNDEPILRNTLIEANTWVCVLPIIESDMLLPSEKTLDVVYEDDLLLIVNKPVGIIIHDDGNNANTLDQIVKGYYLKNHINVPVRPIHRLDKDTSGLVIYCKIPFFQPLLDHMLETKEIARIYLALVKGKLEQKQVLINKPLGKDRHDARKMRVSPQGMYAYTKVLRRKILEGTTLVECQLKTGRTHQIRVHLASIGHPLLSDALYGTKDSRILRCALHAWKVKMIHPITQTPLEVSCEMPQDMLKIIK